MTLNHFTRRLHLYLAMVLLPWFLMYALSSEQFTHRGFVGSLYDEKAPQWTLRFEKTYDGTATVDRTTDRAGRRVFADRLIADLGLGLRCGVNMVNPAGMLEMWCPSFTTPARVRYTLDTKRVTVEDKLFRWDHFLTNMHARAGFGHGAMANLWAVVVDLVSVAFLLWVVTGVYMWWKLPKLRRWGLVALVAGAGSFAAFMVGL